MPTLMGYDPDSALSRVRLVTGVSVSTLSDMEELFEGIDLEESLYPKLSMDLLLFYLPLT